MRTGLNLNSLLCSLGWNNQFPMEYYFASTAWTHPVTYIVTYSRTMGWWAQPYTVTIYTRNNCSWETISVMERFSVWSVWFGEWNVYESITYWELLDLLEGHSLRYAQSTTPTYWTKLEKNWSGFVSSLE